MKIRLYDTTLRDGAQNAGISFTEEDKKKILLSLDALGIDYIEAGDPASNQKDEELLRSLAALPLTHARIAAFTRTCHPGEKAEENPGLCLTAGLSVPCVTVVGKSHPFHVTRVLHTDREENLRMIGDTVAFLKARGKEVFFDAEHFFDGYGDDPRYAMTVLETAVRAGADGVVLCDTNGGALPDVIGMVTSAVRKRFPDVSVGIHCHNDSGMATACALEAVLAGADTVQVTVSGVGERCGNTNLNTILPVLQVKLGYACIPPENLPKLTQTARTVNELMNRTFDESEPFVGGYAFTHKAGLHIDAVKKEPKTMEHMAPETVGNERNLAVSELSGRSAIVDRLRALRPDLTRDSAETMTALRLIKEKENEGYQYEQAEASLILLCRRALGIRRSFYEVLNFQVNISESPSDSLCTALIKIEVGGRRSITAAEGDGPVNALDLAMRESLAKFYPGVGNMRLTDYKVRVLNSTDTTASKVRVFMETTDGTRVWHTIGVSHDIIEASKQALTDAIETKLLLDDEGNGEADGTAG